jgi:riboflavin transporter FmnP
LISEGDDQSDFQDEPSTPELVMIIMNYVACVPVLLTVGGFRCDKFSEYHRLVD